MCEYSFHTIGGREYKCNRKEYKDDFCIFHCDKKNFTKEETEEFNKEFWKEFERQEKDKNLKEFDFTGFKFPDGFSFEGKEFKKAVNFTEATFNTVNFSDATFNSKAHFFRATFSSEVDFSQATFNSKAHFSGATFNSKAHFAWVEFKSEANFSDATFNSEADFSSTTFNSKVYFSGATFSSKAHFAWVEFKSEANFSDATFNSEASFYSANFKTTEEVEFLNVDLSKALFFQCKNIDRISRFEGIKWSEKSGWLGKRKAIYDEIYNENSKEEYYEYIAEIYRKLRLNYERNLRFVEAGDFYIGEMEMRRKNVKGRFKWIKRNFSATAFYKYFSYYGERYWLPLIWSVGIITIFSFLLSTDILTSTQIFLQFPPTDLNVKVKDLLTPIINFTINSRWFVLSERILGILFIALFVLALRRKFKKTSE